MSKPAAADPLLPTGGATLKRIGGGLMAVKLAIASGHSVAAVPAWQQTLMNLMASEHGCQVAYFTGVVERTIDGRQVLIARAHCEDGRAFDASRDDKSAPFVVRACQTTC